MGKFFTDTSPYTNAESTRTGPTLVQLRANQAAILELPGALPPEVRALVDSVLHPTRAMVRVDTEGGAPADNLTAISAALSDTESLHDGIQLCLQAVDPGRKITVKHGTGPGGIILPGGVDVQLGTDWWLTLIFEGGRWRETPGRGDALARAAQTAAENAQNTANAAGAAASSAQAAAENAQTTADQALLAARGSYKVGDFKLSSFPKNEQSPGWYPRDGYRYLISSPQGQALSSLSAAFKAAWGITIQGSGGTATINVPNAFDAQGRGYFERPVDGVSRAVGSVEQDAMQELTGTWTPSSASTIWGVNGTLPDNTYNTGVFKSKVLGPGTVPGSGAGATTTVHPDFAASRMARTADETRPANRGMIPVIFLGV